LNDTYLAGSLPGPDLPVGGVSWQRAPKFQHRYRRHIILFALTLFSTSFAPSFAVLWQLPGYVLMRPSNIVPAVAVALSAFSPRLFLSGLQYSLPLLTILSAHEFGHYFLCRRYNVDATLPYFIPAPLPLTGTLGAVIRIREAFPSKRALFDIGIAGPIAGFVALLPFLYIGLGMSRIAPIPHNADILTFGDPLLLKALVWLRFGHIPAGSDVFIHPMAFAAWFGMLATALNLMPFGQLDGGHIVYAVVGRRSTLVSMATVVVAVLLATRSLSWIAPCVMMVAMAYFLGFGHPRVIDEDTSIGRGRALLAVFAVIMFILCFTPMPIQASFSK
jgi:membrane-associated protease RseP (regulator of RpoE activity)